MKENVRVVRIWKASEGMHSKYVTVIPNEKHPGMMDLLGEYDSLGDIKDTYSRAVSDGSVVLERELHKRYCPDEHRTHVLRLWRTPRGSDAKYIIVGENGERGAAFRYLREVEPFFRERIKSGRVCLVRELDHIYDPLQPDSSRVKRSGL